MAVMNCQKKKLFCMSSFMVVAVIAIALLLSRRLRVAPFITSPETPVSSSGVFNPIEERTETDIIFSKTEAPPVAPAPIASPGELEAILSGARASIEKIRSGRIVYKKKQSQSPARHSDEDIESELKRYEGILRGQNLEEMVIQSRLLRERSILKKSRTRTDWASINSEGEYIFEGDSISHTYIKDGGYDYLHQFYCHEGKMTIIETRDDGDITARIRDGCRTSLEPLFSPLNYLIRLIPTLSRNDLEISHVEQGGGGTVYTVKKAWKQRTITMDIMPDSGYFVSEFKAVQYGDISERITFARMRWEPNAGIYYPTEIIKETFGEKHDSRFEFVLLEVELNIDVDDEVFQPHYEEGTTIIDRRFNPPEMVKYSYPETDGYLKDLDAKLKALKN
jgi:hypothetical protein